MRVRSVILIIGLVLAPACTSSKSEKGKDDSSSSVPAVVDVSPIPEDQDLAASLITEALEGFTPADPEDYVMGPIDLAAAAASEQDPSAERALLTTRRFQRGYEKVWVNNQGELIVASVYRFASEDDARAYMLDGLTTLEGHGATRFDVPEVEGAAGFAEVESVEDQTLTTYASAFVRGPRFFLVLITTPKADRTADDARLLAKMQDAVR